MDPEVLRRLATDRALGELSDDAATLLDAYISEHPDAGVTAEDATDTLATIRTALVTQDEFTDSVPPLRLEEMPDASSVSPLAHSKSILVWSRRTAVAAAIVIAFLLGTRSGSPSISRGPQPNQLAASDTPRPAAAKDSGFWSVQRLIATDPPAARPDSRQHKQSSPWTLLPSQGEQS